MKRSLVATSRTSAGIMSPAESFTTSPGTSCLQRDLLFLAVAHHCGGDIDHRLELGRRGIRPVSCTKRSSTPSTTIKAITVPPSTSCVANEIVESTTSKMTSGIAHGGEQPPRPAAVLALGDDVRPCFDHSSGGLVLAQSLRRGLHARQNRLPVHRRRLREDGGKVDGSFRVFRRERQMENSGKMVHGLTRHSGSHQNRSKRRRLRASS